MVNKLEWTPEIDGVIRRMADGDTTVKEIVAALDTELGVKISRTSVLKHMKEIGAPLRPQGGKVEVTQEMRDFVYVKARDKTIAEVAGEFNAWFGVDWTATRIYRIILNANAERWHRLNKRQFAEDWGRIQRQLSPDGEICRKNWLWRWRRLDEDRTAAGMVFRGRRVEIP